MTERSSCRPSHARTRCLPVLERAAILAGPSPGNRQDTVVYMLFKTIHVIAAIAWLGAGLAFQVMNLRARAAADPAGTAFLADQGEWFGQRFFSVASLTTLVSGVVMVLVAESLSFADLWITVGFAGIIVSIVVGAVLVTRATAALGEAVTSGDTPRVTALQARLNTLGWIDLAVVFTVVAFMVYKPT